MRFYYLFLAILLLSCSLVDGEKKAIDTFEFSKLSRFDQRPITSVNLDEYGSTMVGTWEGLSYYKNADIFGYVSPEITKKLSHLIEKDNEYYAITENGNKIVHSSNGFEWTVLFDPQTKIYDILVLDSGTLIAGTVSGVYLYSLSGDSVVKNEFFFASEFLTNSISYLLQSASGSVFAGTHDGIYRSKDEGQTWEKVSREISKHDDSISMLFERKDGTVIAGHRDVFYQSNDDGENWTSFKLPEGGPIKMIESNGVEYLLSGGYIWVRKNNETDFILLGVEKELGKKFTDDNFFLTEDFDVRNDKIIIYKDLYSNAVFIGTKNPDASIWKELE